MRAFLRLCVAEAIKARSSRALLAAALVLPFILIVQVVGLGLWASLDPIVYGEMADRLFAFPAPLRNVADLMTSFGRMAGAVFGASLVGLEFASDTWKVVLPRYHRRGAFLAAKALTALAVLALVTVALVLVALLSGVLALEIAGIGTYPRVTVSLLIDESVRLAGAYLEMAYFCLLAMLGALVTRSSLGGAVTAIAFPVALYLVAFLSPTIALLLPPPHLTNAAGYALGDAKALADSAALFGRPVPAVVSLLVLALYLALGAIAATLLLTRRDVAGSRE